MKFLLSLLMLFTPAELLLSKSNNRDSEPVESMVYEKVYLHTDKELYVPGEVIWFKSYLVSGINHELIPGRKNLYIQLVDKDGGIVDQRLLLSDDGTANGEIQLPVDLPDGNYSLIAYTGYLKNFGPDSYFNKKILISKSENLLEIAARINKESSKEIDISFLPESGVFVLNTINRIAFKAVDANGRGVAVKGKIVDEKGEEIISFRDSYRGMGQFIIMPEEGKNYFALIDGYPELRTPLMQPVENGLSLNYKTEGNYLLFTMSRNIKNFKQEEFLLTAAHKGVEIFQSQIKMDEFQHAVRFYKGLFPLGISKITLSRLDGSIMAERLVFVKNDYDPKIRIEKNRTEFQKRQKAEINISSLLPDNDTIIATASIAVVDENYLDSEGVGQTIESYLLLSSELKGSIEAPADAFIDDAELKASEKLDLIMMINGWRSYYWDDLKHYADSNLDNWADIGLTLRGQVTRMLNKKPVENGNVILGPFSGHLVSETTTTNQEGYFQFENLYLKDGAVVMINAETAKGNPRNEISFDQPLNFDTIISADKIRSACFDVKASMSFYNDVYYSREAEQEFEVDQGSILLDQIEITGVKEMPSDGHFRLYGEPDHSFKLTDDDFTYANILDYLEAKVPGVIVSGENITIRAGFGNPLLLVDGLEVEWDYVKYLPIGDIDKLEILKSSANMAIYGADGGNGIISILTKMGYGQFDLRFVRKVPGRITPSIVGFHQPRKFYSPKYTLNNIEDPMPDLRSTLYWNPEVVFTDGEAKVEFFTSDKISNYRIIVEGISKNGKIIFGTGLLKVVG